MADRGVSDVVGFTLVFALIVTTVGVVYVTGFSGLEDARGAERVNNADRAFDVLGDNMDDLYREDAPSRATEIKLSDAQLQFGETTRLTAEITNVDEDAANRTFSTSLQPIVYTTTGEEPTRLVFEAGAIMRTERSSGVVRRDAPFLFENSGNTKTAVLPLVQTRSTGSKSVGGDTTVLVRADRSITELLNASTSPGRATGDAGDGDVDPEYAVELTIETTELRAPLWRDHLNDEIPDSFATTDPPCSVTDPDKVTCTIAVERLYVSAARIDVEFS